MYSLTRRSSLFSITLTKQFFIVGLAAIGLAVALFPNATSAFWPFSTNASAAVALYTLNSRPIVLSAATNLDPNPDKGLGANIEMSGGALVANSGPSGTIADITPSSSSGRISVYVVRPGDSLSDIAKMFDVSVNTIVWANNLGSSKAIRPGDTLIILPVSGVEHTVAKGDTLKSLARKYSADVDEIADFNGLDVSAPLAVGTTVIVPGGEIAVRTPVKTPGSGGGRILGGGTFIEGFFRHPLPGSILTQGLHGWNGVDLGAARGTPTLAAADGTVIVARSGWNGGYGTYIVITHTNGTQTLYSHLSSTAVSPGQSVNAGQTIGYVGSTGRSTGSHLHFEVRGAANPLRSCSLGRICAAQ